MAADSALEEATHLIPDEGPTGRPPGAEGQHLPLPGALFDDRYEVTTLLGQGGMGRVYQAFDRRRGEMVALKVVDLAQTAAREILARRFRREFRAISRVRHPNIVRVYDLGGSPRQPYYTMELVEGERLDRYIDKDGRPDPGSAAFNSPDRIRRIIDVFCQVCQALAAIHAARLVHRDLKPANVLVQRQGIVKVMDFGLVRLLDAPSSELTRTGVILGTAAYMSPEQVRDSAVDSRSDLYSLGVMLYQVLAGHLPFRASSTVSLLFKHINDPPPPIRSFNPGVSGELEDITYRLLAKNPLERYSSAEQLEQALRRHLKTLEARLIAATGELVVPRRTESDLQRERTMPLEAPTIPGTGRYGPLRPEQLFEPPVVGRQGPFDELRQGLNRALDQGQGDLVLVTGESGAGKTRLVSEAASLAHRKGFEVYRGRCYEGSLVAGGLFLDPLRLIARRLRRVEPARLREQLGPEARLLGILVPAFLQVPGIAECPPPPQLPDEQLKYHLLSLIGRLFRLTSTPLLLQLDDLQWADQFSMEIIAFLARNVVFARDHLGREEDQRPLVVLMTARNDELDLPRCRLTRRLLAALRQEGMLRSLSLDRLGPTALGQLVQAILGEESVPDRLGALVYRETEGNPYFAVELVRTLVEEGKIERVKTAAGRSEIILSADVDSHAGTMTSGSSIPIPKTIQDTVRRRLERLDPTERKVLSLAAVFGRVFDFDLLWDLAGGDEDELLDVVDRLVRKGVLVEAGEDSFDFYHDKIRELTYSEIPGRRRRRLHRKAAEALEGRGERGELDVEAIARHLTLAGLGERALPYLVEAGERLRQRYANLAARVDFQQAISIYDDLDQAARDRHRAQWLTASMGLAAVEELSGDLRQAEQRLRAILAATDLEGDRPRRLAARLSLGRILIKLGRLGEARQELLTARAEAAHLNDPHGIGLACVRLGVIARHEGRSTEALREQRRALGLALRYGFEDVETAARWNLLGLLAQQGADDDALALEGLLEGTAEQAPSPWRVAFLNNVAVVYLKRSAFEEARTYTEEARHVARRIGDRRGEAIATANLAHALEAMGFASRAMELMDEAVGIFEDIGDRSSAVQGLHKMIGWHLILGDLGRAEATLARLQDNARGVESAPVRGYRCLAEARVALARRRLDDAEAMAEEARRLFTSGGSTTECAECLEVCQRAALEAGDPQRSLAYHEALAREAVGTTDARVRAHSFAEAAVALERLGRHLEAAQKVRAAEEHLSSMSAHLNLASLESFENHPDLSALREQIDRLMSPPPADQEE